MLKKKNNNNNKTKISPLLEIKLFVTVNWLSQILLTAKYRGTKT